MWKFGYFIVLFFISLKKPWNLDNRVQKYKYYYSVSLYLYECCSLPKKSKEKTECADCHFTLYLDFGRHPPLQGGPPMSRGLGRVGRSGPWYWWLHLSSISALAFVGSVVGGFSTPCFCPLFYAIFPLRWCGLPNLWLVWQTTPWKWNYCPCFFGRRGDLARSFANILYLKKKHWLMN